MLLIVVLFMPKIAGVHRWIPIGNLTTFQPSEIAKFAVVILFAKMITIYGEKMKTFRYGILPFLIVLGVISGLMVLEPHLSGTILILTIGIVMMFVGGVDLKWFVLGVAALAAGVVVVVMIPGVIQYAQSRLEYWLDPFADPQGLGFQTIQSLLPLSSHSSSRLSILDFFNLAVFQYIERILLNFNSIYTYSFYVKNVHFFISLSKHDPTSKRPFRFALVASYNRYTIFSFNCSR